MPPSQPAVFAACGTKFCDCGRRFPHFYFYTLVILYQTLLFRATFFIELILTSTYEPAHIKCRYTSLAEYFLCTNLYIKRTHESRGGLFTKTGRNPKISACICPLFIFYIKSYFTTSILTSPSAQKEMPSAALSVYMVAVMTCSPSFTNISALN